MRVWFLALSLVVSSAFAQDRVFEETVAPILKINCLPCHDNTKQTSGLSVLSKNGLLAGGARLGAAITPEKPDDSVLLRILRGQITPRMPLNGQPLAAEKIEAIATWIRGLKPEMEAKSEAKSAAKWWAFENPKKL